MSDNETKVNELNEALKELWDSLTDEQKDKAKECKSMDELMLLAGKMRIELPDELLEEVAGGLIVEEETNINGHRKVYFLYNERVLGDPIGLGVTQSLDQAIQFANKKNISTEVITRQEFERRKKC